MRRGRDAGALVILFVTLAAALVALAPVREHYAWLTSEMRRPDPRRLRDQA